MSKYSTCVVIRIDGELRVLCWTINESKTMQKIATCVTTAGERNLVSAVVELCKKYGVCLSQTRIGRVYTPRRGWLPAVFIVQELRHVAESIELNCLRGSWPVFHVQGEPTQGTIQQYTTGTPVLRYTNEPTECGQIIEYNGNTINVQV